MTRRIKKHIRRVLHIEKPLRKENLHTQTNNVPLNKALYDRISFSVLRNEENGIRKIENISYDININDKWEWVVRYDDHGGTGNLHRHYRINLTDERTIESAAGIRKYKNKDHELTWVCNEIKRDHMIFRKRFLKSCGLDLY